MFHEVSGIESFYGQERGRREGGGEEIVSQYPLENFWLTVLKKILEGTVWCFSSFEYVEKFCLRGYVTVFSRKSSVSQYRKPHKGTLLCFTKFRVSKVFMYRRGGRGRRWYQNFLSKKFVLLPKSFVAEPFSVPLIFGNEKCLG